VIKRVLSEKAGVVMCLVISRLAGLIGKENEFHSRLGKELGAIAKTYGLGGIFHSDELPNYGITEQEISLLREKHGIGADDAFVLIAGNRETTTKVIEALRRRLQHAVIGVPAETRAANLEGETTFLRPRPGAARMYPETDIPLIKISDDVLTRLRKEIPEPWEKQVGEFSKKYDLPFQLAEPMFDSERRELFERIVEKTRLAPRYVASALVDTMLALSRDGVQVERLDDAVLMNLFDSLSQNKFAKEAFSRVLRQVAANPTVPLEDILSQVGLTKMSVAELARIVDDVLSQNIDLIRSRGLASRSILMGKVMQVARGKVDGRIVNETVEARLTDFLKREKVNE
jgi:glutamyl-tRNA(Gln) amidotransferase subunit E